MIALDTNILARFYVLDDGDAQSKTQHEQVVLALSQRERFWVPKTVVLELERVLRGFYQRDREDVLRVLNHLIAMPNVTLEDEATVRAAIAGLRARLDFSDALHHASSKQCEKFITFDDKRFARPAGRLKLEPPVVVPQRRRS